MPGVPMGSCVPLTLCRYVLYVRRAQSWINRVSPAGLTLPTQGAVGEGQGPHRTHFANIKNNVRLIS